MSENCKSLVLQDKCNIEIFLSPDADLDLHYFQKWMYDIFWFSTTRVMYDKINTYNNV